jgi:hypothetical protein
MSARASLGVVLGGLLSAASCLAGFQELTAGVPKEANAIYAADVSGLLKSPLGQKEGWADKWSDAWEVRPLAVPPTATKMVASAQFDRGQVRWSVNMMELDSVPTLQDIARSEGGYVDKIWDKGAVVAPSDMLFVQMSPKILAGIAPGDRQWTARWIRSVPGATGPASDRLKMAIGSTTATKQVVMAIDMDDLYSPSDVRRWIDTKQPQAIVKSGMDLDTMSHLLASIKLLQLNVSVNDEINGQIVMDFDMAPGMLESIIRQQVVEVLNWRGMSIEEIADWKVSVKDKTITMDGKLSKTSLMRLLSIMSPAAPNVLAKQDAEWSSDPQVVGKASKRYYRAVCDLIDAAKQQKASTLVENARWLERTATQIDRLPVTNADPDLLKWATNVSIRLRQCSAMFLGDQAGMQSKQLGIAAPNNYYTTGSWSDGYYYSNSSVTSQAGAVANVNDVARQRTQVVAEQKAASIRSATDLFEQVMTERAQIRVMLSEKYRTNF